MADRADVRSIAAVIDWHASLTTYGEMLDESMAGVDLEIRRVYEWLNEQLARWQRAVRDCEEEVTRAKGELRNRKFPNWDGREPDCTVQEKALKLAKARQEHAEEKVETVRQWLGRLPKLIDETFTGPSRRLRSMLEAELPVALVELTRRVESLESYAGLRPDYAPGPTTSEPTSAPLPAGSGEKSSASEPLAASRAAPHAKSQAASSPTEPVTQPREAGGEEGNR